MRTIPAVELREAVDGDVAIFFEQQDDPVANSVADFPGRDRVEFFAHWERLRSEGRVAIRTIVADGAVAGHLVSWRQPEGRLVGYWLGREFWGRGIATAALQSFVQLFDDRPLFAHTAPTNIGSQRVLEKTGFRLLDPGEAAEYADPEHPEDLVFRRDA